MKCYFGIGGEIVSPSDFVIVVWAHAYSFPKLMVFYFGLVELSKTLENIVELGRPSCFDIVAQPLASWLLYSFLALIFLQWEVQKKEYRKRNRGMNIV